MKTLRKKGKYLGGDIKEFQNPKILEVIVICTDKCCSMIFEGKKTDFSDF